MLNDMQAQRQHHAKMVEGMGRQLDHFRKRYAPGQPFTYEEMRDFNSDLDRLLATVAATYQQPILDSLSNAAAAGFMTRTPLADIISGAKP